jgi:hypothetical protein
LGKPCFQVFFSNKPDPNLLAHDQFSGIEDISKPSGRWRPATEKEKFLGKDGLSRNLRIGVEPHFASFALQQTLFLRLEDGLPAIVNVKLFENVLYVTLDGPNGD